MIHTEHLSIIFSKIQRVLGKILDMSFIAILIPIFVAALLLSGCVSDTGQNKMESKQASNAVLDESLQETPEDTAETASDSLISIKDERYYQIIGQWEDANSVVEYLQNGDFKGKWGNSEKDGELEITNNTAAIGSWYKMEDTLKMRFSHGHTPDYLIVKQTPDTFVIKSLDDGMEFVKTRVK